MWGVVHTPGLVEFFSKFDKAGQSRRWWGDTNNFLVEGAGDVLAEGIHLGFFVRARPVSVGGPFLVPFREGFVIHFQGVQELDGEEFLVDRDEMGFEGIAEVLPTAKVGWVICERSLLVVFGPFSSRGAEFKVGESGGDPLANRGVQVLVKEVVVGKVCLEGFSIGGGTVKRFGGGAQGLGGYSGGGRRSHGGF
jgi:hypothetical protein